MKPSVEILNELLEISPLMAGMERKNLFLVPDGYFTNLPTIVLDQIKNAGLISPAGIGKPVSTVPEDYFENLSSNILNKIKALQNESAPEEIKKLLSVLYSLQDKNVFRVPRGYFDQLSNGILQTIKPQARVVSIKQKSNVWKIAVAAMVTGVIGVSSLWISEKQTENKTGFAIKENKDVPALIEPVQYKNEEQINEGIAKLSDDDIIKYLQTTANASDNEFLTASIEEKELPAQQDYLLDEKTLENYLNKIETNTSN